MGFLLKVKRAKYVLDKARRWMWKVLAHFFLLRMFHVTSKYTFKGANQCYDQYG